MDNKLETTSYRFLSEVRAFLAKLIKNPIGAEPSKYLKDRNFNKTRLINVLRDRGVIERHEKILDSTNSDEEKAKYVVKYKVRKKDFENKINKIYIKYFEKNLPEKKSVDESVFKNEEEMKRQILNGSDGKTYKQRGGINEDGEGSGDAGSIGGTSCDGVASETSRGDMGYDVPFGMINRPAYLAGHDKKLKGQPKPENILGKTITAEKRKPKKIIVTEEQFNRILKEEGVTSTTSVGSMGNYTAGGLVLKTKDGKEDPCSKAGHIKVKQVMDI